MVAHTCHPSYAGIINRSSADQASLGINVRPYSKTTESRKGWGNGSNGGVLAYQAQGPKFKCYYHQQKFTHKLYVHVSY
jgi:hypothetical protein